MLTRPNCAKLLADSGERGRANYLPPHYVRLPAMFAFTHPDGGRRRGVCCDHIAGY